jgi:hypothetical protein
VEPCFAPLGGTLAKNTARDQPPLLVAHTAATHGVAPARAERPPTGSAQPSGLPTAEDG